MAAAKHAPGSSHPLLYRTAFRWAALARTYSIAAYANVQKSVDSFGGSGLSARIDREIRLVFTFRVAPGLSAIREVGP